MLYFSLVDSNLNNTPATSTAQWQPIGDGLWTDLVVKTASFTAVAGRSYRIDTSAGAFTMTLPLSPADGDRVGFTDVGQAFGTEYLTLGRNAEDIMNLSENLDCDIPYFSGVIEFTTDKGWVFV